MPVAKTTAQMIATNRMTNPATKMTNAESVCITVTAKLIAVTPVELIEPALLPGGNTAKRLDGKVCRGIHLDPSSRCTHHPLIQAGGRSYSPISNKRFPIVATKQSRQIRSPKTSPIRQSQPRRFVQSGRPDRICRVLAGSGSV
jgi:hypothetical protein